MEHSLGFEVTLDQPYEQAIDTVIDALKVEGFGVLTRIDVKATLKEKLGADFRPYIILGACNPPLAQRALENAPELGLMLPCNVTVEARGDRQSLVRIANPAAMLAAANQPDLPVLRDLSDEATRKMLSVVSSLKTSTG